MPKIITDIKEKIISEAANIISSGDYSAFSARQIAKRCSIAVGTLYNYFPSIEALIITATEDEWSSVLADMDERCESVCSVSEGLDCILSGIRSFSDKYHSFLAAAIKSGDAVKLETSRHAMLTSEISVRIDKLFSKYGHEYNKKLLPAVTEIIVSLGVERNVEPDIAVELVRAVADKCCGRSGCATAKVDIENRS